MKYRKKPEVVDAFQYKGSLLDINNFNSAPEWIKNARIAGIIFYCQNHKNIDCNQSPYTLVIRTLEGDMLVSIGDYIIKGVNGELYPCKPDIFEETYEKVQE